MAETAFDSFFATSQADQLPAAVAVVSSDGSMPGMVTARFDVRNNYAAMTVASSDDPQQRALCAVYACRAAREAAEMHPDLHAV